MPGGFHTELLLLGKDMLKIFLLDTNWKNPSIEKSSLKVVYFNKKLKKGIRVDCKMATNHYTCRLPTGSDLTKKGKILLKAET